MCAKPRTAILLLQTIFANLENSMQIGLPRERRYESKSLKYICLVNFKLAKLLCYEMLIY